MQKYCLGLYFDSKFKNVLMLKKARPNWQKGKLNFLGGHVEKNESPYDAMVREFQEEVGKTATDWQEFCILENPGKLWRVHVFAMKGRHFNVNVETDEPVSWIPLKTDFRDKKFLPNISWLVQMGLNNLQKRDSSPYFHVLDYGENS